MAVEQLYKYLDADGGLKMLSHHNLQFTNATKLNDPFDCHPSLIEFSHVPEEQCKIWSPKDIEDLSSNRFIRQRDRTWICSLSKRFDSLLMWSYYNAHKGICIGIDMEKADLYLSRIPGAIMFGCLRFEVQYKDIVEKPDYFQSEKDLLGYQLCTKAKAWEHEQEERLVITDPSRRILHAVLKEFGDKEFVDYKEIRFYPRIGLECFDSVSLGVNIDKDIKMNIIKTAKSLNSNIKIYQMCVDPNAFKLNTELINP